ncbi:FAD-dependent oxidoreductase [Streptomyces flavalbus]|uniref:FAD-dependent oxidoreductase n=1 Tax=Streptomyces flavalbus TaxID=2665155 RepID=A0ABW2WEI9_9ACTN
MRVAAAPTRRHDCDVLVIGGGTIGMSTAYALTRTAPGTRVTVLDQQKRPAPAPPTTGVIHSGIHHRPGSPLARYTILGATELIKFCTEYDIPHAVTGKLIVATDRAELPRLHALVQRGRENGIPVRELGAAQIPDHEPAVRGIAAIHVGTTGVCDVVGVTRQLADASGAEIRYGAQVVHIDRRPALGVTVHTADGTVLRARALVNCAGPHGAEVARMAGDTPAVRTVSSRGEYYTLNRPDLLRGLVHPVPDPTSPLPGVHLTRGIDGTVHVGPHATRADLSSFTEAVRRLLPDVRAADLTPAGTARLRDGTPTDDFLLHEAPHTVHVLNVPSPATTASLPMGRAVAWRVLGVLGSG